MNTAIAIPDAQARTRTAVRVRSAFIVGPIYDSIFFIFAPLIAVAFSFVVANGLLPVPFVEGVDDPSRKFWNYVVFAVFTEGHLVLAFVRSHLNRQVFAAFPYRFTIIPTAVFLAGVVSDWMLVALTVLAVWWDVYHSAMQTFGFGRIYDAKAGNDPHVGRRLDFWLNIVIYVAPILAGASLMAHVSEFNDFAQVGESFFTHIPIAVESHAATLAEIVFAASAAFLVYYVVASWRLVRCGYAISIQKVLLLASTAATAIYAWYFNAFGLAFLVMNLFHALQYYAIIYARERTTLASFLRVDGMGLAGAFALVALILLGAGYGIFAAGVERALTGDARWPYALVITVALMHFWYDGFIWSVRKKQV